jgi:hypothetical protein
VDSCIFFSRGIHRTATTFLAFYIRRNVVVDFDIGQYFGEDFLNQNLKPL